MSTYTVSAATNAPSVPGIPVYTTTGQLLTDAGLYSGILQPTLDTTPNITESGTVGFELVWTDASTITPGHPDCAIRRALHYLWLVECWPISRHQ
jgi:hypothetical protein